MITNKKTSDWEKDVDKHFPDQFFHKNGEIKRFVNKHRKNAQKQIIEKLKNEVKEYKTEVPKAPTNGSMLNTDFVNKILLHVGRTNYNKAIDDIITLPKQYK